MSKLFKDQNLTFYLNGWYVSQFTKDPSTSFYGQIHLPLMDRPSVRWVTYKIEYSGISQLWHKLPSSHLFQGFFVDRLLTSKGLDINVCIGIHVTIIQTNRCISALRPMSKRILTMRTTWQLYKWLLCSEIDSQHK